MGPKETAINEIMPVGPVITNNGGDEPHIVNGKRVLREEDAFEKTAYAWSLKKKWTLLTVVALCQTSM